MSNPAKGLDDSKNLPFPSAPSQTLTPEMKKIMDQMRMFFDPSIAMANQGFQQHMGSDMNKQGSMPFFNKQEAQNQGAQAKDNESQKSADPKGPEIPDIFKLFTEIDIPLTKENRKLYLSLYLHGLVG